MKLGILMTQKSNIDIMVHGIFKYDFFGHEVWITTTHVCLLIVMFILMGFALSVNYALHKQQEIPVGLQNVAELAVEKLDGMISGVMDKYAPKFCNYIGTIFIFILLSNFSGLLGLRPPTADYGVTFPLAILSFLIIHFNQFKYNSPKEIWTGMCSPLPPWLPIWFPISLIGELAVPISLSLRLFANILSGMVIMTLLYGLLGWFATVWPAVLHVYFDLFSGAIQTYVFCMLSMTYIRNAIGDQD
jgi:F-type H+-transporting ATPase subunit a